MKLLIAIDENNSFDSRLSCHFGHCPYFAIYSTETKDLKIIKNELDHSNNLLTPADQISRLKIDAVFTLGMGEKAIDLFKNKNILVKTGKFRTVNELIKNIQKTENLEKSCDKKRDTMRLNPLLLIFIFSILLIPQLSFAATGHSVDLHIFYGQGCPHCSKAIDFLEEFQKNNSNLLIHQHEVYFSEKDRSLLENMSAAYGKNVEGVPTIFVGEKVFVGFSDSIAENIINEINRCAEEGCPDPATKTSSGQVIKKLTLPAVILASLVDAINPCAFAVLIILVSTILASKKRKKALFAGLAFSLSIFISYFFMGLGLYSAISASGISHTFYLIVAILAIIIGLFNLKDYLWYGKFFVMEVPLKWRPKMKALIRGVTSIPGAFAIGFLVSLFLLPCTSGPYIVILGLLAKSTAKLYAVLLLLLYNIIFILPMIIITFAVYLGFTTTEKAEEIRQKKLKVLHLIAGIIILCLGIGMLLAIKFGMV